MSVKFKLSQLTLVDLTDATSGSVGWIVANNKGELRPVLIVERDVDGPPECLFVELAGDHQFYVKRIGNLHAGSHSFLQVPDKSFFEFSTPLKATDRGGEVGSLLLTNEGTYLSVKFSSPYGDTDRQYVNLRTFEVAEDFPSGVMTTLSAWKMLAGDEDNRVVICETK